ncbi:MAG: right-handed parallel beta-helix repeat-containing protein [Flavobacteriales bacterium]
MKRFLLSVATLLIIALAGYTQELHVTTSGDDSDPGTAAEPWLTIQHAMDNATAGSTVFIHEGTYNERVYVNVDGEDNAYITFRNFEDDEVIIDGTGLTEEAMLALYDVQYVALEGLNIRNNQQLDAIGIVIEGVSNNIRIKNCEISNINFSADANAEVTEFTNAQPLIVYGTEADHAISSLEITGNQIYNCRLGYSEGMALNGNVDNFQISNNTLHDLTNIGIDIIGHEGTCPAPAQDQARLGVIRANTIYNCVSPYATAAGIYVDGGKNVIIERNHVHHNQWGIEIGCENIDKAATNIIVRNNFIYENANAGAAIGGYNYPNGSGKVENVELVNNSFFGNDTSEDWTGELFISYNEWLTIANNIFYSNNSNGIMMSDDEDLPNSVNLSMFYNQWYHPSGEGNIEWAYQGNFYESLSEFSTGTNLDTDATFTDPNYLSTTGSVDLHLTADSPAIDAATPFVQYGTMDIDGEIRYFSNGLDIGADEFGSTVGITELPEPAVKLYPNPSSSMLKVTSAFGISELTLRDQTGKVLMTKSLSNMLNIESLPSGVYLLEIESSTHPMVVKRVIKQ